MVSYGWWGFMDGFILGGGERGVLINIFKMFFPYNGLFYFKAKWFHTNKYICSTRLMEERVSIFNISKQFLLSQILKMWDWDQVCCRVRKIFPLPISWKYLSPRPPFPIEMALKLYSLCSKSHFLNTQSKKQKPPPCPPLSMPGLSQHFLERSS